MRLELYYVKDCGFCKSVLNTIANLKISDRIILKNIHDNPEYMKELTSICGDSRVPTLVVDGEYIRESEAINNYLVDKFLD